MRKYTANAPLELEHLGQFDKYDFSSETELRFETKVSLNSIYCEINYNNEEFISKISNVIAEDENEAFNKICNFLNYLTMTLSYVVQKNNENSHYGHLKINYKKKNIKIKPRDQSISDSLKIKTTFSPDMTNLQDYLSKFAKSSDLQILINAYYNSLSVGNLKTKFYHAFTIIEYVENRHSKDLNTTPLLTEKLYNDLEEHVLNYLSDKKESKEVINRIKGTLRGTIKKRTSESRKEKLLKILNDVLDINSIKYLTKQRDIDYEFVKNIVNYRNKLFHKPTSLDKKEKKFFKIITDKLIIVCENILSRYLENWV